MTVHVVAVSAYTPVGIEAAPAAAAVRAGVCRTTAHDFLVHPGSGEPLTCASVADVPSGVAGAERLAALVRGTLRGISRRLRRARRPSGVVPVFVTAPEPRPGFGDEDARAVRQLLATAPLAIPDDRDESGSARAEGSGASPVAHEHAAEQTQVTLVGAGHAGFFRGLARAHTALESGAAELCVVCGVDSYLTRETIEWLHSLRRLKGPDVRGGFTPGEAAGALCVASERACERLGLASLARIRALANAEEPRNPDSPEGLLGEGLTAVLRRLAESLRLDVEGVDAVYCDLNGERSRTEEWGFAALRSPPSLMDPARYVSAVGSWGDVGAATGALSCVLALQAFVRRHAPGPRALAWGSSWGGMRGGVVLEEER